MRFGRCHFLRGGGKGGGNQQGLAGNGLVVAHLGFQALVHDALVRGVHIDDDHALGVFRQDVNAVDLRHRRGPVASAGPGPLLAVRWLRPRELWQQGRWWRLGGFLALAMRAAGWLRAAVPTGPACVWGCSGVAAAGVAAAVNAGANAEGAAADKGMANCWGACFGHWRAQAGGRHPAPWPGPPAAGHGARPGHLRWRARWPGGLRGCRESATSILVGWTFTSTRSGSILT